MSNGNAAAALILSVAILTGIHLHGSAARRHADTRHSSALDRTAPAGRTGRIVRLDRADRPDRAELGDARIPVRTVRRPYTVRDRPRDLYLKSPGKAAAPEVIVGYVDPARGSTAFHRLTNVVEGDRVKVVRRNHSVDWFKVDSVRRGVGHSITQERSSSDRPELRLISSHGKRSPRDVVVAHLDRPAESGDADE